MFNSVLSFKLYFQKDIDWLIFSIVTNLLSLFISDLQYIITREQPQTVSYKNSCKKYLSELMQSSTYRANTT